MMDKYEWTEEMKDLAITVVSKAGAADFRLLISVVDPDTRETIAAVGACDHHDHEKLHVILHAYRMGRRFANKAE